jgi:hypothetical protein
MRLVNRILALVLGVALLAGAIVLIIEVVAHRVGAAPVVFDWTSTYRWARRTTWDSGSVRLIGSVLAILGLALLIAQLVPRRPSRLGVRSADDATDAAITRHGLARALSDAVNEVDGVHATRVAVRRRRVRINARTRPGHVTSSARDSAIGAAQRRLDALALRRPPRVTINMASGRR